LEFKPGWSTQENTSVQVLLDQLRGSLDQDKRRKQTTLGPQQDDFEVVHESRPARRFASQGQQRSCALAMLLSVVQAVVSEGDEKPVILLDDVSSELDSMRRDRLFEQICRMGSQVLVTTTDEALVSGLSGKLSRRFTVQNGLISKGQD
jgi:DNA replication and repair protein RecF